MSRHHSIVGAAARPGAERAEPPEAVKTREAEGGESVLPKAGDCTRQPGNIADAI